MASRSLVTLLQNMITAMKEKTGITVDVILTGTHKNAIALREALEELKYEAHVIIDIEIGPEHVLVTSMEQLEKGAQPTEDLAVN